jgi:hypothetical protein
MVASHIRTFDRHRDEGMSKGVAEACFNRGGRILVDDSKSTPRVTRDRVASVETLLARIDERTQNMQTAIDKIDGHLSTNMVSRLEFKPIQLLCYGAVGIALTGFATAVITHFISGVP